MVISGKYDVNEFINKLKNFYYITISRSDLNFYDKTSYRKEYVSCSNNTFIKNEYDISKQFNSEQEAIDEINKILSKYPEGRPTDFIPGENLVYKLPGQNTIVYETFKDLERNIPGRHYSGWGNREVSRKTKPFSITIFTYNVTCLPIIVK